MPTRGFRDNFALDIISDFGFNFTHDFLNFPFSVGQRHGKNIQNLPLNSL
jgi:hypothetical protein